MSYCIIIPNYNHTTHLETILIALQKTDLQVLLVNDGSHQRATEFFIELESKYKFLNLIHRAQNGGKGAAVKTGLIEAHNLGFNFALQLDADGQHCLEDVNKMIRLSKLNPQSVISGAPIFDDDVPKHRLYSRYITHFWVWIETLSFSIVDTMCGFRVYPLKSTNTLLKQIALGDRMDFDIEILVRLYWRGIDIKFLPTKVVYPKGGESHFRPLKDNVLISWMHTRLVFGMLIRSPLLILRNSNNFFMGQEKSD